MTVYFTPLSFQTRNARLTPTICLWRFTGYQGQSKLNPLGKTPFEAANEFGDVCLDAKLVDKEVIANIKTKAVVNAKYRFMVSESSHTFRIVIRFKARRRP